MPTARELLEQADALMRRNRSAAPDDIPVLTEAVSPRPTFRVPLRPSPESPPPADAAADEIIPTLTEKVPATEAPAAGAVIAEGEPSDWLDFDEGEPSVTGKAPDSIVEVPDVLRATPRKPNAVDEALQPIAEEIEMMPAAEAAFEDEFDASAAATSEAMPAVEEVPQRDAFETEAEAAPTEAGATAEEAHDGATDARDADVEPADVMPAADNATPWLPDATAGAQEAVDLSQPIAETQASAGPHDVIDAPHERFAGLPDATHVPREPAAPRDEVPPRGGLPDTELPPELAPLPAMAAETEIVFESPTSVSWNVDAALLAPEPETQDAEAIELLAPDATIPESVIATPDAAASDAGASSGGTPGAAVDAGASSGGTPDADVDAGAPSMAVAEAAPTPLPVSLEPSAAEALMPLMAPAVAAAAPAPDDARWAAMAEEIRMQVLQRIDLFTDTGLREQLGRRLQPIVDRASADLVATINQHVGELLRAYVAEAIEREIENWRKGI